MNQAEIPNPDASRGRSIAFDLIRFIAALIVVIDHFAFSSHSVGRTELHSSLLAPVIRYGYVALDVFFIVSGYFIMQTAQGRDWRSFAIARVSRVYPALIACASLTFLGSRILSAYTYRSIGVLDFIGNITGLVLIPGIGQQIQVVDVVYWTIQIEIAFYLIVGVGLAIGLVQRPLLGALLGLCLASMIARAFFPGRNLVLLAVPWFSRFVFGGVLFLLARRDRSAPILALGAGSLLLMLVSVWQGSVQRVQLEHTPFNPFIGCALALAAAAMLGWFVLRPTRLQSTRIAFAGGIAYPLYLVHHQLGCAIARALGLGDSLAGVLGMTVVMVLVAALIHRVVEQPLIPRLRRALARSLLPHRSSLLTDPSINISPRTVS